MESADAMVVVSQVSQFVMLVKTISAAIPMALNTVATRTEAFTVTAVLNAACMTEMVVVVVAVVNQATGDSVVQMAVNTGIVNVDCSVIPVVPVMALVTATMKDKEVDNSEITVITEPTFVTHSSTAAWNVDKVPVAVIGTVKRRLKKRLRKRLKRRQKKRLRLKVAA